jgi:hypothetical protein
MALLDDVLIAHGGIDRWRSLHCFTVHFSIDGSVLASSGRRGALRELAGQGSTRTPSLHVTGFPAPDKRSDYRADGVIIEMLDGMPVARRDDARSVLRDRSGRAWDDLDLACFCGIVIWSCLAAPFLLAGPDVRVAEIGAWQEHGETWQRLKAVFPPTAGTLATEQTFYFDQHGLQRRTDYLALDADNTSIAQYSRAHQAFSEIIVPTLHRGLILQPDGTTVRRPPGLDIEIFDLNFD